MNKDVLKLYLITDENALQQSTLAEAVKVALENGVTCLQYREKAKNSADKMEEAQKLLEIARAYEVPFIINDDIDLAIAINADGVHLGQGDMEAGKARQLLGADKIIGVTAKTLEQATAAEKAGADYIGVGAVFPTSTKSDAKALSMAALCEIVQGVEIPAVAIGGIHEKNVSQLLGSGISGIAVVSGILSQPDIAAATRILGNWELEGQQ